MCIRDRDNCLSIGLNTVIVQVRPFGDALYRSSLFPWSHVCTGEQGKDPGFDPLDVLITEAHSRGLSLEAWVNPYRLRSSAKMLAVLAESSLANTHPAVSYTHLDVYKRQVQERMAAAAAFSAISPA